MSEDNQYYFITKEEIMNYPNYNQYTHLEILKEKGAPVIGCFHLEIEDCWEVTATMDEISFGVHFYFKRKT